MVPKGGMFNEKKLISRIIFLFFCSSIIFATQYEVVNKKNIPSSSCSNRSIIKGKDMVQYEGWIYYSNQEKGGGIYRQSIDGLCLEKLNDAKSDYINIVGNSIYFRQVREHAVCKMSLDGSKISIIKKSAPIRMLDVINKSIIYSDGENIYCIQDGVGEKTMLDVDCPIIDFSISNNGLLYSYVEKLDGKESVRQKLVLR